MNREILQPTARMYRALRNQKRPFGTALAEWIENALGENRGNAERVWITVDERHVSILDDGQAPTKLGDVVQIGAGAGSGGYDTGRFGWGGSIAQLTYASKSWMYGLRRDGLSCKDKVSWDRVVEHEEHPAVDSTWGRPGRTFPKRLRELGHGFLLDMEIHKGKHISSSAIKAHIAREFAAGLRAGKRIYWVEKGVTLEIEPWRPPDLSDVVMASLVLEPGNLHVELEAGWSDKLSPADQGLELEYGPRRLGRVTSVFEGYRGPTIFGWLRLVGDGWLDHFESEKTGIASDVLLEALETKAHELLLPLMEELKKIQRETALVEIAGEVADALNKLKASQTGITTGWDQPEWEARGGHRTVRDGEPPKRAIQGKRLIRIEGVSNLGTRPFEVDCPIKGDWWVQLNEEVAPIRRALEERPPDKPLMHQVLAMAVAFEIVKQGTAVELGLYSQDEFDSIELEAPEDVAPIVFQRLLGAISA
ncbi:MAG: hypothetical protein ACRDFW_05990 [bacterium]